jgi:hypothetical protein
MLDLDVVVKGPFSRQPFAAKLGCIVLAVASALFLIFLPVAAAVAVLAGIGVPAPATPNLFARFGPFSLLLGILCIGVWVNWNWIAYLSSGGFRSRVSAGATGIGTLLSGTTATIAAHFHVLATMIAVTLAVIGVSLIVGSMLIGLGQSRTAHRRD